MKISEIQKRLPILERRIKELGDGYLCEEGVENTIVSKQSHLKRLERELGNINNSEEIADYLDAIRNLKIDIKLLNLIIY